MTEILDGLQGRLGYVFRDKALLRRALTHRSYAGQHNERLEFLGDAILDLLIGEQLYHRYTSATEGELSHMRAQVVCGETLAVIGKELQLGDCLYLGAGESNSGGRDRQSNLANTVEALVASIYLDAGIEVCRTVTGRLFSRPLQQVTPGSGKDPKTILQEYLQARQLPLPQYREVARTGSEHAASFTMECVVAAAGVAASATASSRKKAEQQAAAKILETLGAVE